MVCGLGERSRHFLTNIDAQSADDPVALAWLSRLPNEVWFGDDAAASGSMNDKPSVYRDMIADWR
jgi:hypothetical protein